MRFWLTRYMREGGRKRRPIWAASLVDDLTVLETAADESLAAAAHACRLRATELISWIEHTDAAIVERLVVERTTPILGSKNHTAELRELVAENYANELDPVATLTDPLYLLIHHVASMSESVRNRRDLERSRSSTRCLTSSVDLLERCAMNCILPQTSLTP